MGGDQGVGVDSANLIIEAIFWLGHLLTCRASKKKSLFY